MSFVLLIIDSQLRGGSGGGGVGGRGGQRSERFNGPAGKYFNIRGKPETVAHL